MAVLIGRRVQWTMLPSKTVCTGEIVAVERQQPGWWALLVQCDDGKLIEVAASDCAVTK